MTQAFEALKALLDSQDKLSVDDMHAAIEAHGDMTDEELMWLEAEQLERVQSGRAVISMDEYLAATQVLDSTPEDSAEHKQALLIVETFERGG